MISCLIAAGCSGGAKMETVFGSGRTASETRAVSDFDHITVAGGGEIVVEVTGSESLTVEAEDNLLGLLTADVVDGDLRLGVVPYTNIEPIRPIVYRITAVQIDGVAVSGSATIEAYVLDTDRFSVTIAGSGRVTPLGTTTELAVEIGGSGRFEGAALSAEHGNVSVAGSGEALVNVSRELTASVSGSGRVEYLGEPVVHTSVSGSGSIGSG